MSQPSSSTGAIFAAPTPAAAAAPPALVNKDRLVILNYWSDLPQLIVQPPTLDDAIKEAKQAFDLVDGVTVILTTQITTASGLKTVALSKASWDVVASKRNASNDPLEFEVVVKDPKAASNKRRREEEEEEDVKPHSLAARAYKAVDRAPPSHPVHKYNSIMEMRIYNTHDDLLRIKCKRNTPMIKVLQAVSSRTGVTLDHFHLETDGGLVVWDSMLAGYLLDYDHDNNEIMDLYMTWY